MHTPANTFHTRLAVLFVGLLGLGYSVFLHDFLYMEAFWDTANYHYFIGWAASNLSSFRFGAAAGFHTYLNPLLDVVNYQLFNLDPYAGAAFHSLALALTLALLFRIALMVANDAGFLSNALCALLAVAIGATGAMTVTLFGSFTNEHLTALLLVAALGLSVDYLRVDKVRLIFVAGLLAGAAVGLKLTALTYFFALLISIALVRRFHLKTLVWLLAGAALGLLLTDGLFMLLRWQATGNPVFPLANNIFHSPLYSAEWKSFGSFEARLIDYYLSLPVVWLSGSDYSEAVAVRDGRLLLAYIGLAMLAVSLLLREGRLRREETLVVCFFVASWILWILLFRIYRYLLLLELMSGLVFWIGLRRFIPARPLGRRLMVFAIAGSFLYFATVYPNWGRRPWSEDFIKTDIREKLQDKDAIVLFGDDRLSYFAPTLHGMGVRFANLYSQPWYDGDRKGNPLDRSAVPVTDLSKLYFLQLSTDAPSKGSAYLKKLVGERAFNCTEVETNMVWKPYLCHYQD